MRVPRVLDVATSVNKPRHVSLQRASGLLHVLFCQWAFTEHQLFFRHRLRHLDYLSEQTRRRSCLAWLNFHFNKKRQRRKWWARWTIYRACLKVVKEKENSRAETEDWGLQKGGGNLKSVGPRVSFIEVTSEQRLKKKWTMWLEIWGRGFWEEGVANANL